MPNREHLHLGEVFFRDFQLTNLRTTCQWPYTSHKAKDRSAGLNTHSVHRYSSPFDLRQKQPLQFVCLKNFPFSPLFQNTYDCSASGCSESMCAARDCAVEKVCPQILHVYSSASSERALGTDISVILYHIVC
jgi:hypothetical protein